MRRAYLNWRLGRPKENSKQKKRDAHTQLHMLRKPGLLRSVLVMALDLAHVHAARVLELAPWPPQRELEA